MKRNLFIAIAFVAGVMLGAFFFRLTLTHAQDQPSTSASPQDAESLKYWQNFVKARDEAAALRRRQTKTAMEGQDLYDSALQDLKKLDSIPEKDRQLFLDKIDIKLKLAAAARAASPADKEDKSPMEVFSIDPYGLGNSSATPFSEVAGISCVAYVERGTTRCFVVGRR